MAIFKIDFRSRSLNRNAPLTAIVPVERPNIPGVDIPERTEPFKTIYLLHGFSGSQNDWLHSSRIEALAKMYGVAVVMPAGENSFYLNDEILAQYYEDLVCEEIVAFTREVFPLSEKREDTTIAGLSMGGYGALRNGFKHSDVFGSIFAFSSALITDRIPEMSPENPDPVAPTSYFHHRFGDPDKVIGSDVDPKALATKLVKSGDPLPKVYMSCGTEDFLLEHNRDLHQHMDSIGFEHTYVEGPGIHNWAFWDQHIEEAMKWLYKKPLIPQR